MKRALLIGINYTGSKTPLRGCIADVQHIKYFLLNFANYQPSEITVLTDESIIKPTKQNIQNALQKLISNTNPGDHLLFYYSGHGAEVPDYNKDEYRGKDQVLVPLDYQTKGIISDDWLHTDFIAKVKKDVTLYGFLDCCNSGTLFDLKFNWKSNCKPKNNIVPKTYNPDDWTNEFSFWREKTIDIPGKVIMFSGCMSEQTSADAFIDNTYQGAFSYCFISFLKENLITGSNGKKVFKNGVIKVRNLLKEINAKLDIFKYEQNSQLSCGKVEDFEDVFTLF